MNDVILIGFGCALAILKIIDYMVRRKMDGRVAAAIVNLKEDHEMDHAVLCDMNERGKKLWSMHDRYDEDGSPMWYIPRSWNQQNIEIAKILNQVVTTQLDIVKTLERMETKFNKY